MLEGRVCSGMVLSPRPRDLWGRLATHSCGGALRLLTTRRLPPMSTGGAACV